MIIGSLLLENMILVGNCFVFVILETEIGSIFIFRIAKQNSFKVKSQFLTKPNAH